MKKIISLLSVCFLIITSLHAQTSYLLQGKVLDESNLPLPGVNVFEKTNPTKGVITDFDGNFSIEIEKGTTLMFKFIGFNTQEVAITGQPTINIKMLSETLDIDEVVVTALGIKRTAKKVGFAVTEIKGDEISKQQVVNPVLSLQGKAAGLSITGGDGTMFGSSKIQLRGVSVLNSNSNQPIFVVDGIIMDVGTQGSDTWGGGNSNDFGSILKNLDLENVDNVSVLKGAAATALYGSRGINGAIIISTKNAESVSKGLGITVKQTFGFDQVYDQLDFQYEYGPGYFAGAANYGSGNKWETQEFRKNNDGKPTIGGNASWLWGPKFDPDVQYEYWDGKYRPYVGVKDHVKKAFDTGTNNTTYVAVNGGTDKTRFFVSDTYTKRKGIFPRNKFQKNSLKLSGIHQITDNFNVKANVTITNSKPENPNNGLARGFVYGAYSNMYDPDEWGKKSKVVAPHGGLPSADYGDEYAYMPGKSIWFDYYMNSNVKEEDLFQSQTTLSYSPVKWLTLIGEYYRMNYNTKTEEKRADRSFEQKGTAGFYSLAFSHKQEEIWKLNATYNHEITTDLAVNGMIGMESWETEHNASRTQTNGGLVVPGQYFIGNSRNRVSGSANIDGTKKINSLYGTASFEYKNAYFLELTGRNDWSSALTYVDGSGNNSYFYPSVSFSWLSDNTFNLPDYIDMAKLRMSWAQVGNDTGAYFTHKGYGTASRNYSGDIVFNWRNGVLMDPDIKPEMKTSYEVGIDVRTFKNRYGLDAAWYRDDIENQIGEIGLDSSTGYSSLNTNIGTLRNEGFELSLFVTPILTNQWRWKSTINWWKNKTEVTELHEEFGGAKRIGGDTYSHFFTEAVAVEGGVYGELRSPQKHKTYFNEDNPNDPKNGMKLYTFAQDDRCIQPVQVGESEKIGNIQPDFEWSWSNEVSYKNLNLSFLIDGRYGGTVLSHENRYSTYQGQTASSLYGRSAKHGGVTFQSSYADDKDHTYHDGIVEKNCVFDKNSKFINGAGQEIDISGKTMEECVNDPAIGMDPVHASIYHVYQNDWGVGAIHDGWVTDVKYIALRNINLSYNLGQKYASKIGAQDLTLGVNVRNVLYLYNNMPNNVNPESVRGNTSAASYFIQSAMPYTRYWTFSITAKF